MDASVGDVMLKWLIPLMLYLPHYDGIHSRLYWM